MNRIARTATNLTIATGLALGTLTLSVGTAHAGDKPGPVIVLPPAEPQPPKGPGEIAQPTPDPQPPVGPGDIQAPPQKPQPPKGPKDLAQPKDEPKDPKPADPQPAPQAPESAAATKASETELTAASGSAEEVVAARMMQTGGRTFDSGLSYGDVVERDAVPAEEDGAGLAWLLAGLGLAGATGLVLVAVRRRSDDEQAEQI